VKKADVMTFDFNGSAPLSAFPLAASTVKGQIRYSDAAACDFGGRGAGAKDPWAHSAAGIWGAGGHRLDGGVSVLTGGQIRHGRHLARGWRRALQLLDIG
jgi:hypothetical protein